MHFYKLDADLIYQIYRNYKKWILENPTKSQELEMAIKWGSYLIAGRFQNASLLCEITYAGSRLLEMFNNSILSGKLPQLTFAQYDRLKLLLTIVEYIEVLIEMIAVQIWGETGRWAVIALIQLTKAIWKMVLLFKHKMILIGSPAVKPVNRLEVLKERKQTSLMNGFSSPKRVTRLPRSGRLMRTLDGSAPHHIRSFSPPFELVASNSDDQLYCKTHLPINMLTAEVLHICRPIGHLTSMYLFGVKSWVPWCFALGIDFTSLGLYNNCVLTKEERSELACRRFSLLLYLIRTPAFHAVTHRRINQFLIAASDKIPFARFICQPLLEYVPEWQNMYSYTWS